MKKIIGIVLSALVFIGLLSMSFYYYKKYDGAIWTLVVSAGIGGLLYLYILKVWKIQVWFKQALILSSFFVGTLLLNTLVFPDVVNGVSPVRKITKESKEALQRVAGAANRDSALTAALKTLPGDAPTLEGRVAQWLRVSSDVKIDSMKFMLLSGVGITAADAENRAREGYARNEVVVRIFFKDEEGSNTKQDFFLVCANGLISKRWPGATSEESIGRTRIVSRYSGVSPEDLFFEMGEGENLCLYYKLQRSLEIAMLDRLVTYADDSVKTPVRTVAQGLQLGKKHKVISVVPLGWLCPYDTTELIREVSLTLKKEGRNRYVGPLI